MKTLGIDLSSQNTHTAACLIEWRQDEALVAEPFSSCSDEQLDALIADSNAVGIDAPFGWPVDFAEAVGQWKYEAWTNELRDAMRFRETDRVTRQVTGRWPLSVSTDLIALPAMRAMALLKRHGVENKAGGEKGFYEVYPAASLRRLGLALPGYKKDLAKRQRLLTSIREKFPQLRVGQAHATTDHCLDALVASLTARLAATGQTTQPSKEQQARARREGWIHIPV